MNALRELFLLRVRTLTREPAAFFWVFAFPLLTSVALGLAFRNQEASRLTVAVADGPEADRWAQALSATPGLSAARTSLEEGRDLLRRGKVALVLVGQTQPEVIVDPTQPDSRPARLMTLDALERLNGRADTLQVTETRSTAPGSRYIDFLIPGLLGAGLMSSALWGLGWALVQMRTGKLLKRFVATPMRRSHFLLSFVLSRGVLALAEIFFFIGFARLLFGVRVFGSFASLTLFALVGAFCFAGISLLIASRAQNSETASGLMNLVSLPMYVMSGVFFASSHFPLWSQPILKALPLTALNDGLRAIMIDGASLLGVGPQGAVLLAWGAVTFVVALRIFRWS